MTAMDAVCSAITVVGMSGIFFIGPDTVAVDPVKTHRPSSKCGLMANDGCCGSRTPPNAHCVFHQANFR